MEKYLQKIYLAIGNTRFMASSLSNLAINLSLGSHIIKCKYRHNDKKFETSRIKYKYCDYFLEYANFNLRLNRIQMFVL